MAGNGDTMEFKRRRFNLRETLKTLREHEIINGQRYTDFALQLMKVQDFGELDRITHELAGVCEGKKG